MKKKLSIKLNHYIFILSLILISCVGVGFSSWLIEGGNSSANGDVNINVGEVNGLYSDAISIDTSKPNNGIEPLYYTTKGFINKDSSSEKDKQPNSQSYAELGFNIIIHGNKLVNYFSNYNSLYIYPYLSVSGNNAISFSDTEFESIKLTMNNVIFSSSIYDENNNLSSALISSTNVKGKVSIDNFLLTYNRDIEASINFKFKMKSTYSSTRWSALFYERLPNSTISFYFDVGAYNV